RRKARESSTISVQSNCCCLHSFPGNVHESSSNNVSISRRRLMLILLQTAFERKLIHNTAELSSTYRKADKISKDPRDVIITQISRLTPEYEIKNLFRYTDRCFHYCWKEINKQATCSGLLKSIKPKGIGTPC
uniref:Uncharacterized protein n=1 Tax=Glossina palpalis gambiensis TaxID=67801 RepID=A0A1B0C6C4_9MUSC